MPFVEMTYNRGIHNAVVSNSYGFNLPIISKNIKSWDECLPSVEMTYNRAILHSTVLL